MVLIAGFRAGLAGWTWVNQKTQLLNPENLAELDSLIFIMWVWAGLAGF